VQTFGGECGVGHNASPGPRPSRAFIRCWVVRWICRLVISAVAPQINHPACRRHYHRFADAAAAADEMLCWVRLRRWLDGTGPVDTGWPRVRSAAARTDGRTDVHALFVHRLTHNRDVIRSIDLMCDADCLRGDCDATTDRLTDTLGGRPPTGQSMLSSFISSDGMLRSRWDV